MDNGGFDFVTPRFLASPPHGLENLRSANRLREDLFVFVCVYVVLCLCVFTAHMMQAAPVESFC